MGTPVKGYDQEGSLIWQRELDSYGNAKMLQGEEGFCNYLYQGQTLDSETGLAYNRFRYYDPEQGNYISQDPIGLAGGLLSYGYVQDSTIQVDFLGLEGYTPQQLDELAKQAHSTLPSDNRFRAGIELPL